MVQNAKYDNNDNPLISVSSINFYMCSGFCTNNNLFTVSFYSFSIIVIMVIKLILIVLKLKPALETDFLLLSMLLGS